MSSKVLFRLSTTLAAGAILSLWAPSTHAQEVKLSGLAYMDYAYVLDAPDDAAGDNGFGYRRLYLTSDFDLSDDLRFRARLEANDGNVNGKGNPVPFVKDLHLRWRNAIADGHDLFLGISGPPAFSVSEGFFGYRSLEKTIMDRNKIVSSRDFGVALKGRLNGDGSLRYGLMIANGNSVKAETDRHKRLYAQLEFRPSDKITVTVGGDYASMEEASSVNLNGFAGYDAGAFRVGVEGYYNPTSIDVGADLDRVGFSAFAAAALSPEAELLARFDTFGMDDGFTSEDGSFFMAGLAWTAREGVRIMPNVLVASPVGDDDPTITGRITAHIDF